MQLELPPVPAEQETTVEGRLRYEDVAQDGHLLLTGLPHFMGLAVFGHLLHAPSPAHEMLRAAARAGCIPIVSRMAIAGGAGPVSVRRPVQVTGGFELGHTVNEHGEVNRLMLNTFAAMQAPAARTNPPQPANAGEILGIGRVFVEHVFTRLFAPPGQRKVLRLPPGPWPDVPPTRLPWRTSEDVVRLPPAAVPVNERPVADEAPVAFGLMHTDSNQHVNSLAYPRLFEEAVLRRLAALGRPTALLARAAEIAYRKPLFAGQRAYVRLRLYEHAGKIGAVGGIFAEDGDGERPNAAVAMELA